ncbi:ATP-binding cassette domain-containing protein [Dyadobacter sp. LHD-138]|uniref:ABC transporter ATP-binding protein n=1 Tax=Dyadobacter sp. LHD-138 TaxID=3071413 RepID=UPI0027E03E37|nr:ATP-binding cassette domain-containing protein [Dyadobacter sp. LHD-138]MDQ6480893.1 ATP-binding cassette domain-containing protein [Dyadobacter sp. LHD-138]
MSDKILDISIRHSLQTANGILPMEISFVAEQGSITAITGPSGAGKTTLLRQIAGLINPNSGYIRFAGNIWLDTSVRVSQYSQLRNIGFVFQDYALFPHLTVRQNLLFALDKNTDNAIVDELLNAVELTQLADRKPHQLSGGQQQRVALARALVRKPDLLLLDEPLAALDHHMRRRLQAYLLSLQKQLGFTMLIVTHDLGEIFRMAHQVIVIENGQIASRGTPSEVYLPENEVDDQLILYGEVLFCTVYDGHLLVNALIQQSVRNLKLPLHWLSEMSPGRSFALRYSLDIAEIELIK